MELSSIFCKVHYNNHIEIDLDYKAYCSECVNDSIKNNLNNPQEIKSNKRIKFTNKFLNF